MYVHQELLERARTVGPVRVGLIGAGKFGSMFLAQARFTPGFHVVGIADLAPAKARESLKGVGWQWQRTQRTDPERVLPIASLDTGLVLLPYTLGIFLFALGAWWTLVRDPTPTDASVAVLPFVNMSADPENEYFSDGVTEEIINSLTKVEGLNVIARSSAFMFKGQDVDPREVGKQLNVAYVLEGSVRKYGNQVRVSAQLIKAWDGFHIFSEVYNEELKDK